MNTQGTMRILDKSGAHIIISADKLGAINLPK
jgi:hypothetical protein